MYNVEMKKDNGQAIYLYCFACPHLLPTIEKIGIDGKNPIFLHSFMGIAAILSMVSFEDFCGPSAEANLQDLAWVGLRACCHEKVAEKIMDYSPVFPAGFGTVFSSLASLEKLLKKHHTIILQFLEQQTCNEEWAVKGMLDRAKAKEKLFSTALAIQAESLTALSLGTRYFQEQRIRNTIEKELKCSSMQVCNKIINDLKSSAVDSVKRKILSKEVSGSNLDMIQNWAFLVSRDVTADFYSQIQQINKECAPQGLVFELSGPWPPYSFCPSLEM